LCPFRHEMAPLSTTEHCAGVPVLEKADAQAFKWHLMAALHGCREAQFKLACMYTTLRVDGCVARQDSDGAAAHFHANPCHVIPASLGASPHGSSSPRPFWQSRQPAGSRSRIEQNDTLAAEWARKAAEQGQPGGQFLLGLLHWTGRGVDRNDAAFAYSWLGLDFATVSVEHAAAATHHVALHTPRGVFFRCIHTFAVGACNPMSCPLHGACNLMTCARFTAWVINRYCVERAAEWEPGHGPAHAMIGAAHYHGWGVPRNERTASDKWGHRPPQHQPSKHHRRRP